MQIGILRFNYTLCRESLRLSDLDGHVLERYKEPKQYYGIYIHEGHHSTTDLSYRIAYNHKS